MVAIDPEPASTGRTRILVVDDHPIVRRGLIQLISHEPDLEVCAEASDAAQTLRAVEESGADIVILDISLPGTSGIEVLKAIQARCPGLPVLVLSMHDEMLYAERVLRAGARGYIMKQEAAEEVVAAVRKVLGGGIYVSNQMSARMLREFVGGPQAASGSLLERLSDRELEVFELIGRGKSTREIAEMLHLSVKTVETHRAHIKEKLQLKSATELLQQALLWMQAEGIS